MHHPNEGAWRSGVEESGHDEPFENRWVNVLHPGFVQGCGVARPHSAQRLAVTEKVLFFIDPVCFC
jgi:hypothetical protein